MRIHNLKYMKPDDAEAEIDKGIAADEKALHGVATTTPSTPFFRFPYFESTPQILDQAAITRNCGVRRRPVGERLEPMAPKAQLKLLIDRLKIAGKGIILLHDPKAQTAAMLPAFLRYLRDNHYRVVHLVPARRGVGVARVP